MGSTYESKKWTYFASRHICILKRSIRNYCYLYADKISPLNVSTVITISSQGLSEIYIPKKEHQQNLSLVLQDYVDGDVEKRVKQFQNLLRQDLGKDPVQRSIRAYQTVGATILYSHTLERVLTQRFEENKKEKGLAKLLILDREWRDMAVKFVDKHYDTMHDHLQKKFKGKNIETSLLAELLHGEVKKRADDWIMVSTKSGAKIVGASYLKKQGFAKVKHDPAVFPAEVRGTVVYKGSCIGEVLVAHDVDSVSQKVDGKILVCSMTLPQFVPYMKKVKAIITDEGGLTCHAAVAARELRVPCIVGTKIASKVFADGDVVEVDGKTGVVKKI